MGLDMFLDIEVYNPRKRDKNGEYTREIVKVGDKEYHDVKILKCDFGYWRKANAIHSWFVRNIQEGNDDCKEYYVSKKQLAELRQLCLEVLQDKSKADELLPTTDGFFFGSTEYDDYYFEQLEYTYELLKDIENSDDTFVYHSSW